MSFGCMQSYQPEITTVSILGMRGLYCSLSKLKPYVFENLFSLNNLYFWIGRPRWSGRLSWWWWRWWWGGRQGRHATIVKESKVWVLIPATACGQYLLRELALCPSPLLSPQQSSGVSWMTDTAQPRSLDFCSSSANSLEQEEGKLYI